MCVALEGYRSHPLSSICSRGKGKVIFPRSRFTAWNIAYLTFTETAALIVKDGFMVVILVVNKTVTDRRLEFPFQRLLRHNVNRQRLFESVI